MIGKPITNLFKIPLHEAPANHEYQYWHSHLPIAPVSFESEVIHGKGIAKSTLGFPTANLKTNEEAVQSLKNHPNGIYLVNFSFL